jgi:hypothetical protein
MLPAWRHGILSVAEEIRKGEQLVSKKVKCR